MKITLHHPLYLHEIGQRENNEDNVYPAKGSAPQSGPYQLYLVCDGVGGMERGEVASQITCDVVSAHLTNKSHISETDIDHAILLAEQAIDSYIQEHIDALGMATTLTLLSTNEEGVTIAHIGDSRIYHIRGAKVLHKTFDHSFVNELLVKNIISEEEALNHPKRNVVTKAIMGGGDHQHPDYYHTQQIKAGDYFFLCTDGITESVSDDELVSILDASDMTNEEKMDVIRRKCKQNSKDNHSAYLLQVKEVDKGGLVETISAFISDKPWQVFLGVLGLTVLILSVLLIVINTGSEKESSLNKGAEKIETSLLMLDSAEKEIDMELEGDTTELQDSTLYLEDSTLLESELASDTSLIQDTTQLEEPGAEDKDTSQINTDEQQNE